MGLHGRRAVTGIVPTERLHPASPRGFEQAVEVIDLHRLLEHQEVECVQLAEDIEIGCGVRGVGINHQGDVAEVLPDRADELDVAPRLDPDLDPTIPLVQVSVDRLEQLDDRRIKPDGQA